MLHSTDEVSDEGYIYQIGRTLNPMQDPVQAKSFRGSLIDKFPPGTYVEGETTASYSANQLRLLWSRSLFLGGGRRLSNHQEIYVFEVANECQSCRLTQMRSIVTSDTNSSSSWQSELIKQSCEIRSIK